MYRRPPSGGLFCCAAQFVDKEVKRDRVEPSAGKLLPFIPVERRTHSLSFRRLTTRGIVLI